MREETSSSAASALLSVDEQIIALTERIELYLSEREMLQRERRRLISMLPKTGDKEKGMKDAD